MITDEHRQSLEELDERTDRLGEIRHPVLELEKRVTELFEDFYARWDSPLFDLDSGELEGFHPRVDVSEDTEAIRVTMELPGVTDDDLDISLTETELVVAGRKAPPQSTHGRRFRSKERVYGPFRRVFALRTEVEIEGVRAKCADGVLEVILPKSRVRQPNTRRVRIQH